MTVVAPRPRTTLGNRRRLTTAIVIVVGALGYLVYQGLGNATVYFRTADEAVAHKAELGTRRFRIEGVVLAGSVHPVGASTAFSIGENGVNVDVIHQGDPPELFKPNVPVVLEGRWDGDHFASDRIMIKHSATYVTKNPDRVKDYPLDRTTSPANS